MKKRIICFCIAIIIFAFAACSSSPTVYDRLEKNLSPFADVLPIAQSQMFIGKLPEGHSQGDIIEVVEEQDHCVYKDTQYTKIPFPEFALSGDANWQLDCNYLDFVGTTPDQKNVYAINEDTLGIVSLLITGTGAEGMECSWYISEALDVLNPCNYELDDFDYEIIYGKSDRPVSTEQIWSYHTDEKYNDVELLLMEDTDFQHIFFRSKEHPWLVYEFTCTFTYEGCLYIQNVPNKGMILLKDFSQ